MKITVGIGALRPHTIDAAVQSICLQTWRNWELIIVGQGSNSGIAAAGERLQACDPRITYIHLAEPGLSRARNEVICRAQGEVIAFTDDDCEADPEWLAVMAGYLQSDRSVGLVGGALIPPPLTNDALYTRLRLSTCPVMVPAESLYDPEVHRRIPPHGWDWVGASVAVRAGVMARVGPFDELLGAGARFPAAEETDYKLRLENMGVRMLSTPRAIVRHTYGRRVGLREVRRSSRSYARGSGGLAGKLTLLDDRRGREWYTAAVEQFWRDLRRPHRLPAALHRMRHFMAAYHEVLARYTIDVETGCLAPKGVSTQ
jgi:glycosyltransferase involved in cell wall biosynthesis